VDRFGLFVSRMLISGGEGELLSVFRSLLSVEVLLLRRLIKLLIVVQCICV
jgi:hypothetical protein